MLVHRDLKPEMSFFTMEMKIVDFGIAALLRMLTSANTVVRVFVCPYAHQNNGSVNTQRTRPGELLASYGMYWKSRLPPRRESEAALHAANAAEAEPDIRSECKKQNVKKEPERQQLIKAGETVFRELVPEWREPRQRNL